MAIKVFDGGSGSGYSLPTQTGNAGKTLTTNGTTATWQMPGFNLITSGVAISGSTFAFTNIPQTYNHLRVIASGENSTQEIRMRLNAGVDSFTSAYHQYGSASAVNGAGYSTGLGLGNFQSSYGWCCDINIPNYTSITRKKSAAAFIGGSGGNVGYAIAGGGNQTSTAVSQIDFVCGSGFSNFSVHIYGWN
jgi:hypothetical protein